MDNVELHPATQEEFMNFELSEKNIEEIHAASDFTISDCMSILWEVSTNKTIVTVAGKPVALLGIAGVDEMWFFFHADTNTLPIEFFKRSRAFVGQFEKLHGNIYYKNTGILKWAKFLGFTIGKPRPFGMHGELFCEYSKGGGTICV